MGTPISAALPTPNVQDGSACLEHPEKFCLNHSQLRDQRHIQGSTPCSNPRSIQPLKTARSGSVSLDPRSWTKARPSLISVFTIRAKVSCGSGCSAIFVIHPMSIPVPDHWALQGAQDFSGTCKTVWCKKCSARPYARSCSLHEGCHDKSGKY